MNTNPARKTINILMVEDNPGDVRLTIEAFNGAKIRNHIDVVQNGVDAMAFLRQEGNYASVTLPDLILLDLNLPKKDGREVLAEIKADEHLRRIPVVILTSSEAEKDIVKAYDLHANAYISKPVELEQFIHVVKSIEDFWVEIVRLPPSEEEV